MGARVLKWESKRASVQATISGAVHWGKNNTNNCSIAVPFYCKYLYKQFAPNLVKQNYKSLQNVVKRPFLFTVDCHHNKLPARDHNLQCESTLATKKKTKLKKLLKCKLKMFW